MYIYKKNNSFNCIKVNTKVDKSHTCLSAILQIAKAIGELFVDLVIENTHFNFLQSLLLFCSSAAAVSICFVLQRHVAIK